MKIHFGKSLQSGKSIDLNTDKLSNSNTNMLLIGVSGSGKTVLIHNLVNQLDFNNVEVIVITEHVSDYTESMYTEKVKQFNASNYKYIVNVEDIKADDLSAIHKRINRNQLQNIHTVLIIDCGNNKKLNEFMSDMYVISRVHNCSVISTWFACDIDEIPIKIQNNSAIIAMFQHSAHYVSDDNKDKDILIKLKRGQFILNTLGHKALVSTYE